MSGGKRGNGGADGVEARIDALETRLAGIERSLEEIRRALPAPEAGWAQAAAEAAEPVAVAVFRDGAATGDGHHEWQAAEFAPREHAVAPADVAALIDEAVMEPAAPPAMPDDMMQPAPVGDEGLAGIDAAPEPSVMPPLIVAPPATLPVAAAPQPKPQRPRRSAADIERAVSGAGLAWVGGLALVLGSLFFLGLAINRGWIGPSVQVAIGLVAGAAAAAGGYRLMTRRDAVVGGALVAVGLGVWNLALYAGTRLYGLIPLEIALAGVLAGSMAAAAIAVRRNSQVVAALGLVVALAAPIIYGGTPQMATVGFLGVILAGTAAISLWRRWSWLPPIAFVLSAPQLWTWTFGHHPEGLTLAVISAFWAIYAVSATGLARLATDERDVIIPALLMMADTVLAVILALFALHAPSPLTSAGLWLAAAAAHAVLAVVFVRATGDPLNYGGMVTVMAAGLLAFAAPAAWDGARVPIAWALTGVALAAMGRVIRYPLLTPVGAAFGVLAGAHLVTTEYPFSEITLDRTGNPPFASLRGAALAVTLGSLAAIGRLAGRGDLRSFTWLGGTALLMATLPHELSGVPLLAAWCALAILAAAVFRLPRFAGDLAISTARFPSRDASAVPAAGFALLAAGHYLAYDAPLARFSLALDRSGPSFRDGATVAAAMIAVAAAVLAVIAPWRLMRAAAVAAVPLAAGYLMPFELAAAGTVIAWAGIGGAAALASLRIGEFAPFLSAAGLALLEWAVVCAVAIVAPPSRLFVSPDGVVAGASLPWAVAGLAAVAAGGLAAAWAARPGRVAAALGAAAGVIVVYLLSIATVGVFQARVGPGVDGVAVARQAQVALSILWAVLGGATLAAGLARFGTAPRLFGLALLALAAAKVFLHDLASLDAAYRVLSLLVVGALLLASSWVYRRGRERDEARLAAAPPPVAPPAGPGTDGMTIVPLAAGTIIAAAFAALAMLLGRGWMPQSIFQGVQPPPAATHRPAVATSTYRPEPTHTPWPVRGRSLQPSMARGVGTIISSDFDTPTQSRSYNVPGLSALEGNGSLILSSSSKTTWPLYVVSGEITTDQDFDIVATVDHVEGGAIPAARLRTPDGARFLLYVDVIQRRWATIPVTSAPTLPALQWNPMPDGLGDIHTIELMKVGESAQLAVNGRQIPGVLSMAFAPGQTLALELGAYHLEPFSSIFRVTWDGYAIYNLPASASVLPPLPTPAPAAPTPTGTAAATYPSLRPTGPGNFAPIVTSQFTQDRLVYPVGAPGVDVRIENGRLSLSSTNPDYWPTHSVSGKIAAGEDAVVVATIAEMRGGGIPAVLLNAAGGEQVRVYVDVEGGRWAVFPATAGKPPVVPIQWRAMPADLADGAVRRIEVSVIDREIRVSLDGTSMEGLFDLPAQPFSGQLTVALGAYHAPAATVDYSVAFEAWGLFEVLPGKP